jgi:hypothetical protein
MASLRASQDVSIGFTNVFGLTPRQRPFDGEQFSYTKYSNGSVSPDK